MAKIPGFEIVGDVAIVEVPEGRKDYKRIAQEIVKSHPSVKTVLRKTGEREGEFRLRGFKPIIGNNTETIHKENGCRFLLDPTKVYFSPREATERGRIASFVKPKEDVMILFSGAGPYCVVVARNTKAGMVWGIESNPAGHKYALENARLNKIQDRFEPVLGDAKTKARRFYGKCDRVAMPLPKEGYRFLNQAIKCIKPKGGWVHFYFVEHENELWKESVRHAKAAAEKAGRKVRIVRKRKVLPYGPRTWKVCLDLRVMKS